MELSTRELENSVAETSSPSSSRGSSPLLHNGGSFEDIGGGGFEIEEVCRLERKLKVLEKAETTAVNKVKSMAAEIKALKTSVAALEKEKTVLNSKLEELSRRTTETDTELKTCKQNKSKLENELKEMKSRNFEDLQVNKKKYKKRK